MPGCWSRARTSEENLFLVLLIMAPLSQELEPPPNPERFRGTARSCRVRRWCFRTSKLGKNWCTPGPSIRPSNPFIGLAAKLSDDVPGEQVRHDDWMQFSQRWCELTALRVTLGAKLSAEQVEVYSSIHVTMAAGDRPAWRRGPKGSGGQPEHRLPATRPPTAERTGLPRSPPVRAPEPRLEPAFVLCGSGRRGGPRFHHGEESRNVARNSAGFPKAFPEEHSVSSEGRP